MPPPAPNPDQFPNYFVCTLTQSLALGGSETEIFISSIKTLDGQSMQTSDFSMLGEGVLTVDVLTSSRVEFISFTGVNSGDVSLTGAVRGLSFKNKNVIPSNKKFHSVGAPCVISFGTQNLIDLETIINSNYTALVSYITNISINGSAPASTSEMGISRMSFSPDVPIANCTISLANPAVITVPNTLTVNDLVIFETTGSLPSSIIAGTPYYVLASGLSTSSFEISATAGGTPINTLGEIQSGTQSVIYATPTAVSVTDPAYKNLVGGTVTAKLPASATITGVEALYSSGYQSDGGPAVDGAGVTGTWSSTTGVTLSLPISNNPNRGAIVVADSNVAVSGATVNGSAMTLIDSILGSEGDAKNKYIFYINAPIVGTASVVITAASGEGSAIAYSVYNIDQSGQPEAHAKSSVFANPCTNSLASLSKGAFIFSMAYSHGVSGVPSVSSSASAPNSQNTVVIGNSVMFAGFTPVLPDITTINNSVTFSGGSADTAASFMISLTPATVPVGAVAPASSANAVFGVNKYSAFIGFSTANASVGNIETVTVAGVVSGLSGLIIGTQYYLNDTPGTIGTSPGTNSRKVGIAITATQLLLTNIW